MPLLTVPGTSHAAAAWYDFSCLAFGDILQSQSGSDVSNIKAQVVMCRLSVGTLPWYLVRLFIKWKLVQGWSWFCWCHSWPVQPPSPLGKDRQGSVATELESTKVVEIGCGVWNRQFTCFWFRISWSAWHFSHIQHRLHKKKHFTLFYFFSFIQSCVSGSRKNYVKGETLWHYQHFHFKWCLTSFYWFRPLSVRVWRVKI